MSKKKRQTLGYFGFTKKAVHRRRKQEIKIPNFIDGEDAIKLISCLHCPLKFKNQHGLGIHIKCKRKVSVTER